MAKEAEGGGRERREGVSEVWKTKLRRRRVGDGMGLFVNDEGKGEKKGKRRDGILSHAHPATVWSLPPSCCIHYYIPLL